jgi:uroporphyrinogen decarboxylase
VTELKPGFQASSKTQAADAAVDAFVETPFMQALRRQKSAYTPVWLMRQAGRFMPEYREVRAKTGFLELCHNSELCAEVTVMAVKLLKVDAAIIFSDILLPLQSLGCGLEFVKGDGPVIHNPVRSLADVEKLPGIDCKDSLFYVLDAVKAARRELPADIPLIGFAGAPFTLASYLIEGGSSRNFEKTKRFMYTERRAWDMLMQHLSKIVSEHLNNQIEAGAQAVQIFDSWIGCLGQSDYIEYVLPHVARTIAGVNKKAPLIHFGTGTSALLELMKQAGGDAIGVDWRIELGAAWEKIGQDRAVQGNLDPVILFAGKEEIKRRAEQVLKQAGGRPGHVFNLGHGVLPETPYENVKYLVEVVHELGSK